MIYIKMILLSLLKFEGDYDAMHAKKKKLSNIIEVSNQDFIDALIR